MKHAPSIDYSADFLMTKIRTYLYVNVHIIAFFLLHLRAFGHFCGLALYDIRSSHLVKETSACVCHLHKGNSKYADTFTTAQADLRPSESKWGFRGILIVGNYMPLFTFNIHLHYKISP